MVVVLEQYHRLLCCLECYFYMLCRAELRVVGQGGVGLVEESHAPFHTEDATHGIIDALHTDFPLVDQLDEQVAELQTIGVHRHIDTCIDGNTDGVFLVYSHLLTLP